MVSLFLAIVMCYVLSALAVLALRGWGSKRREVRHYVLLGDNHELQMEGYIRAIRWFSLATGSPVKITVIDEGSTDQTAAIVQKLAREDAGIGLHRSEPALEGERCRQPNELDAAAAGPSGAACRYLQMLHAEGIVSGTEHAVLVDLRRPEQLGKLPLI